MTKPRKPRDLHSSSKPYRVAHCYISPSGVRGYNVQGTLVYIWDKTALAKLPAWLTRAEAWRKGGGK